MSSVPTALAGQRPASASSAVRASTLRCTGVVSRLPYERLLNVGARMREAAARPVIVPEQVVIDHGKVFVSDTLTRACERLGISIQPARQDTPTDKAVVEATFTAIKTLFAQPVAGFKAANTQLRGRDVAATWTLDQLQDLLDE
ncbi:DDE-type integrase/transposase/recombinase [Actinokineospora iranica]|uniref:DDE-type integrase/transposase/recombinase n=1 Tax=Actinokineospora iranica TaxID=1271860 RepID=UPI0011144796|nr:DDE-type integrase/transposase/recombinase [Actinokineospora iranica]